MAVDHHRVRGLVAEPHELGPARGRDVHEHRHRDRAAKVAEDAPHGEERAQREAIEAGARAERHRALELRGHRGGARHLGEDHDRARLLHGGVAHARGGGRVTAPHHDLKVVITAFEVLAHRLLDVLALVIREDDERRPHPAHGELAEDDAAVHVPAEEDDVPLLEDGQRAPAQIAEALGEARGERAGEDGDGHEADEGDAEAEDLVKRAGVARDGAAVDDARDRPPEALGGRGDAPGRLGGGAGDVVEEEDGEAERARDQERVAEHERELHRGVEPEEAIDAVADAGSERGPRARRGGESSSRALGHGVSVPGREADVNPEAARDAGG